MKGERREERGLPWRERRGGGLAGGTVSRHAPRSRYIRVFLCTFWVRDGAVRGVRRRGAKQLPSLLVVGHADLCGGITIKAFPPRRPAHQEPPSIYLSAGCTFERSPPVGLASTVESSF